MTKAATSVARKRIAGLLDEGSFLEIGGHVTARSTDFNMGSAARTRQFWAARLARCMQRRSAESMSWP